MSDPSHPGQPSPRQQLEDMARGFFRGKVLVAAVQLGIADALADGERTLDELASATASHRGSLHRLLRTLASMGLLVETAPERFRLLPLGRPLCKAAPDGVRAGVPTDADTYLMKHVLHIFDDERALRMLAQCHRAMAPTDRLLVLEHVLPERIDRADPVLEDVLMDELNMLAVTGGSERSEPAWRALLLSAGFALRRVVRVDGTEVRIVEATRADGSASRELLS